MRAHPRQVDSIALLSGRTFLARRCVRQLERANRTLHLAADGMGFRMALERLEDIWPDLHECGKWLVEQARQPDPGPTIQALCKEYSTSGFKVLTAFLPPLVMFEWAKPIYELGASILAGGSAEDRLLRGVPTFYLAKIYQSLARYQDAERWFRVTLQVNEREYGPDHPYVGQVLHNLAVLLQELNRSAEAEQLLRRAVDVIERGFGPDHLEVSNPLNSLGYFLLRTGRSAEAEPLLRRALEIEEAHGADGPGHGPVLNNMALLLWETGRFGQAEQTLRRSIDISQRSFGPEHCEVATSLVNLGHLLQNTYRLPEAEEVLRRAIEIHEHNLGPDSAETILALDALARVLAATNRREQAEALFRRCVSIGERRLPLNHPTIGIARQNLATFLQNQSTSDHPTMSRQQLADLVLGSFSGYFDLDQGEA